MLHPKSRGTDKPGLVKVKVCARSSKVNKIAGKSEFAKDLVGSTNRQFRARELYLLFCVYINASTILATNPYFRGPRTLLATLWTYPLESKNSTCSSTSTSLRTTSTILAINHHFRVIELYLLSCGRRQHQIISYFSYKPPLSRTLFAILELNNINTSTVLAPNRQF
ncbi:hypothetical protein CEXT_252101 [Caerostris extrusa]|uniref:Uncharacterized protein n=1 Tax=Caerostris extrusa TaxID=172846 RepID=A0AAV4Y863_CAEEX|nr:hypothetical protein CEXT_252101 [Caerostris extrusa]